MNERFEYCDQIFKSAESNYSWLSLKKNEKSIYRIFRTLSGTCSIKDLFTGSKTNTKKNYFYIPFREVENKNRTEITNLFPDEMGIKEINNSFRSINSNKDFYSLIEPEITNCIVARNEGRYVESFLFLYRCLEGISYSIPLIYIAKQKSFNKSYKSLQKYMSKKDNEGELIFFKRFLRETLAKEQSFQTTIQISLDDIGVEELRSIYYKYYKSLSEEKRLDEADDEFIEFSFVQFFEFLLEVRNRYFHFLQGTWKENISTLNIVHPDIFFKPIIDHGINWLAVIFFEIIKFEIENLNKHN